MKNLKKTLSLVLALVMVVGMFTVTASAAEVADLDAVNAKYVEAVAVVNGMGIIEGDENGVFNPKGEITRAGMAKLISYIVLGKEGAENLPKTSSEFTDVAVGEWYTGYINYCATAGYIDGNGDGTYSPDAGISGYGVAKLLLSALGYGKNGEYLGDGWEMRVAQDALNAKIFAGNVGGLSEVVATREEVAQYIYNTLQTVTVTYLDILKIYSSTGSELSEVVGYGAITKVDAGVITNNTAIDKDAFDAKTGAAKTTVDSTVYTFETGLEDLGTYVEVFVGAGADNGTPVYAMVTKSTKVEVAADITTAAKYTTTFGTVTTDATGIDTFADGYGAGYAKIANSAGTAGTDCATDGVDAAKAGTYHIYDGKFVGYVAPQGETLEQVKEIKTESDGKVKIYTKGASGKLYSGVETKYVVGADAVAKNDVVLVAQTGEYYTVKKAETVEGQVTAVTAAANGTLNVLTIGGKTYAKSAANEYVTLTGETAYSSMDKDYVKDNTTKLYLDSKGAYVVAVSVTAPAAKSDIVYVDGSYKVETVDAYGEAVKYAYVQVVEADGTVKNLLVDVWVADYDNTAGNGSVAGWDVANTDTVDEYKYYNASGLYTYSAYVGTSTALKDTYTLAEASTTVSATAAYAVTLTNNSAAIALDPATTIKIGDTYVNADTKYIYIDGAKSTLTATVKGITDSTIAKDTVVKAVVKKDAQGNAVAQYIFVDAKYAADTVVSTDYIYFVDVVADGTNASGTIYKGYLNGVASELVVANMGENTAGFYKYTVKDGVYTLGDKMTAQTGTLAAGVTGTQNFASLYGTKITTTAVTGSHTALTDVEAGSAVIVDTRTAAEKTASGVDTITSLDQMLAYKTAETSKTVTFRAVITGTTTKTVSIIYVNGPTSA